MPRVVLITGANRGFGHALAQVFLTSGDYVVATARDPTTLAFKSTTTTSYLPLKLDVTDRSDIEAVFQASLNKFGRLDVVINNAAYGLIGPLETLSDKQVHDQFDTNFFPVVTITREAIGTMRAQNPSGGTIIQASTIGAALAAPHVSIMSASKIAVEKFTECVGNELKPEWGVQLVTLVMSSLDTEAHAKSMVYGDVEVGAYDHLDARAFTSSIQPDIDTKKAAFAVKKLLEQENLPKRVMWAGTVIHSMVVEKREQDRREEEREDILNLVRSSGK